MNVHPSTKCPQTLFAKSGCDCHRVTLSRKRPVPLIKPNGL